MSSENEIPLLVGEPHASQHSNEDQKDNDSIDNAILFWLASMAQPQSISTFLEKDADPNQICYVDHVPIFYKVISSGRHSAVDAFLKNPKLDLYLGKSFPNILGNKTPLSFAKDNGDMVLFDGLLAHYINLMISQPTRMYDELTQNPNALKDLSNHKAEILKWMISPELFNNRAEYIELLKTVVTPEKKHPLYLLFKPTYIESSVCFNIFGKNMLKAIENQLDSLQTDIHLSKFDHIKM